MQRLRLPIQKVALQLARVVAELNVESVDVNCAS